jgi:tRNA G18 (ribose-2'-O)-methylase SpoU
MIVVDDARDPRLADFFGLADPELRMRVEPTRGFFIAESPLVIRTLVGARRRVRSVLVAPRQAEMLSDVLDDLAAPVYVAPREILREVVGFDLHRGAVASLERWPLAGVGALLEPATRVAVLERANDHENLGVLFRNAAAFGIDAVVLDPECADPLYRRSVRVSIGHVGTVPWTRGAAWPEAGEELRAAGLTVFALTPAAAARPIDEVQWPDRVALVLGAEGPGLSDAALDAADELVRIPMRAGVDSLNVATAAAVAFYELSVSRRATR